MAIKKIDAWEDSAGELHIGRAEAEKAERELRFNRAVKGFVEEEGFYDQPSWIMIDLIKEKSEKLWKILMIRHS